MRDHDCPHNRLSESARSEAYLRTIVLAQTYRTCNQLQCFSMCKHTVTNPMRGYIRSMCFIFKFSRIAVFVLFSGTLLLSGCVTEKSMVPPYHGRAQREAAMSFPREQQAIQPRQNLPSEIQKPENVGPVMTEADLLLPALTRINERIFSYEQKLSTIKNIEASLAARAGEQEKLEKISMCRQQLEDILGQYNGLHQQLLHKDILTQAELFSGKSLLNLEKDDFNFLESDCGKLLAKDHPERSLVPVNKNMLKEKEQAISSAYAAGEYKKTIDEYEQFVTSISSPPSYGLTFAYAQALMKTGNEQKSRKIFSELLARIRQHDQAQWEFKLMQLIGDLDFALGAYDQAKKQYSEIVGVYQGLAQNNEWAQQQLAALNVADEQSDEVKAYADLLRSFLAYNPERDGYTVVKKAESYLNKYSYSLVASSADQLIKISRKAADAWYGSVLQQVDQLAGEKRYQDALLVIERVPRLILPVEKQQELATKAKRLRTTEAINRETTVLAQEQQAQESWNTGMTALEAREYDKAIEAFTKVLGTSYDDRAHKKIDEAANLAAREDRRRAAELFVRSGRTHDLWSRKKLLLASRQLLQDILIKYPESELTGKVKRNLQRIDEEIKSIDPSLLSAPTTVNGGLPESVENSTDAQSMRQGRKNKLQPARAVQPSTVVE